MFRDAEDVSARSSWASAHLIVCLNEDDAVLRPSMRIVVAWLSTRTYDVSCIIDEYAQDALATLGSPDRCTITMPANVLLRTRATTVARSVKSVLGGLHVDYHRAA